MFVTAKVDSRALRARLSNMNRQVHRTAPEVLESEGRICAISLATSTQPFGTGRDAQDMGERAVMRDIAKVYATVGSIFGKLPPTGQGDAKQFWKLISIGEYDAAHDKLRGTQFGQVKIGPFDGGGAHQHARSSSSGRVGSHSLPDQIVTDSANLEAYVEKKKQMVGFAKSAWASIARQLGGTRGLRAPKLAGGQRDITANWITRKHAPGSVIRNYGNGSKPVLTLRSEVKYASHVLSASAERNAIRIAQGRIIKQIQMAARYEMRHARAA